MLLISKAQNSANDLESCQAAHTPATKFGKAISQLSFFKLSKLTILP